MAMGLTKPFTLSRLVFNLISTSLVFCEQGILLKRVNSDRTWQWLTKYQLAHGSGWSRDSTTGSYVVCDIHQTKTNETNNWLVSERVINVPGAITAQLSVKFTARQCNYTIHPHCRQDFNIHLYQTDSEQSGGITKNNIRDGAFTFIARFSALHLWNTSTAVLQNTVNTTLALQTKGFYVALQDVGGCFAVEEVAIFYFYCPFLMHNGAIFNKTFSPRKGVVIKRTGKCLKNSSPTQNESDIAQECRSDGKWVLNSSVTCLCNVGYEMRDSKCQACSAISYKSEVGNELCTTCPTNSHSSSSRNSCKCNNGFYRSADEPVNTTCTTIPSEPRNLNVAAIANDVIVLSWQLPLDDGGRHDITFNILCNKCSITQCLLACENVLIWPGKENLKSTSITISKLVPESKYLFTVISVNGVSGQAKSRKNTTLLYVVPSTSTNPTSELPSFRNGTNSTIEDTCQDGILQQKVQSYSSIATVVGISVTVTLAICFVILVILVKYLKHRWLNPRVGECACTNDRVIAYSTNHDNYNHDSTSSVATEMSDWAGEKITALSPTNNILSFLPVNNFDEHCDKASARGTETSIPAVTISVTRKAWTPMENFYDVQLSTSKLKEVKLDENPNNEEERS